jgi:putative sterol carrier protein
MPSVAELFSEMPDHFDATKAGDMDAIVQFDLSGAEGGEWHVIIADGDCSVEEGSAESPNATIRMDAEDYADMLTGKLDPMSAFLQQKVKVEGDLNTVMKFQTLFN